VRDARIAASCLLLILIGLVSCSPVELAPSNETPLTPTEEQMNIDIHITSVELDKSFYKPGEPVQLSVYLQSGEEAPVDAQLDVVITHLAEVVDQFGESLSLASGDQVATFTFTPPGVAPRGYGLDLHLKSASGAELDLASAAFDVLIHWTQTPRYGFLSDFPPDRPDVDDTIAILTRYHVNALQFYDWMYRHEQLLTSQEPYTDLLDRQLSLATVKRFITAAHQRNIAAMPYTAVYGASMAFYQQHPDWALLKANREPEFFGEDYLVIMDLRPGSPWVAHVMNEFDQVLMLTAFDGIHLDQYGDPKVGYDTDGNSYGMAEPLAAFINETKAHVLAQRQDGAVVFNAVTNWPIESVAPADQDLVYIEVWPPYTWYEDLHDLITQAQKLGGGKPVVLAAYIDPSYEYNIRLIEAVIFASGGGHIELGEQDGMLAEAYFPRYKKMSTGLTAVIHRYYDFAVRYQDVIGPRTTDVTQDYSNRIQIDGVSTSPSQRENKIWPIVRESDGFLAINLINLMGVDSPEWEKLLENPPTSLGSTTIRVLNVDQDVNRVWYATPDNEYLFLEPLEHMVVEEDGNKTLLFEIPALQYWGLIIIEWSD